MTVADRTPSEIGALSAAASIGCDFDGVNCIAWKGDPALKSFVDAAFALLEAATQESTP